MADAFLLMILNYPIGSCDAMATRLAGLLTGLSKSRHKELKMEAVVSIASNPPHLFKKEGI